MGLYKKVVLDANGAIIGYLTKLKDSEEVVVFDVRGKEIACVRSEYAGKWLLQTIVFDALQEMSRLRH
jgi:RPA family protein